MAFSRKWTAASVVTEIRYAASRGVDLSYSGMSRSFASLVRAAEREYGGWGEAVAAAGIDYEAVRRYRRWTRERVVERIRELAAQGQDLSWSAVSTRVDPALAAAALYAGRFASWPEALQAAGLDPRTITRYRRWSLPQVYEQVQQAHHAGIPLEREALRGKSAALLAAVDRMCGGLRAVRSQLGLVPLPEGLRRRHQD